MWDGSGHGSGSTAGHWSNRKQHGSARLSLATSTVIRECFLKKSNDSETHLARYTINVSRLDLVPRLPSHRLIFLHWWDVACCKLEYEDETMTLGM